MNRILKLDHTIAAGGTEVARCSASKARENAGRVQNCGGKGGRCGLGRALGNREMGREMGGGGGNGGEGKSREGGEMQLGMSGMRRNRIWLQYHVSK